MELPGSRLHRRSAVASETGRTWGPSRVRGSGAYRGVKGGQEGVVITEEVVANINRNWCW